MITILLFRFKEYEELYSATISETSNIIISENEWVGFLIESDYPLGNSSYLWLMEYSYPLLLINSDNNIWRYSINISNKAEEFSYKSVYLDGQKIIMYKFFINHTPGISAVLIEEDQDKTLHKIGQLEITVNKISLKELEDLYSYLLDKGATYWEPFSKTYARINDNLSHLSIYLFLKNLLTNLDTLKKNLHFFKSDPIIRLTNIYAIETYNNNLNLDEKSVLWLLENSDQLTSSNFSFESSIKINNKFFNISKINARKSNGSTDLEDNRTIHGYLLDILSFLKGLEYSLIDHLFQVENIFKEVQEGVRPLRLIDIQAKKFYYNQMKDCIRLRDLTSNILSYFKENLPVSKPLFEPPKNYLNGSKQHYFLVNKQILDWYNLKRNLTYGHHTLFYGTKTLDQLYEIFCLFAIIDTIKLFGFGHPNFKSIFEQNKINYGHQGIYDFSNNNSNNLQIKLFYECMPPNYETIKNTGRWNLSPDFIIQYKKPLDSKWQNVILDAKYKKYYSVKTHSYDDVIPKYLHGIGRTDGDDPLINGLYLLYPQDESRPDAKLEFYHRNKYTIFGSTPILPSIGIIQIPVGANKSSKLFDVLSQIFYLTLLQ